MRRTSSTSSALPGPPWRPAAALLLAALAPPALAAWATGRDDAEAWRKRLVDDGRTPRLLDASGNDCIECHVEIGEEWRDSAHAIAWQDEHYHEELGEVRRSQRERCYGCHVPEPLVPAGLPQHPEPREADRHLGIDCRACHLAEDGETILGTLGLETDAHPTRRSEHLAPESALCISCHATTIGPVIGIAEDYVATEQVEVESCIGCHMPMARGPLAVDPQGEVEYEERRYRSHRLETVRDPKYLARAFRLEVAEREGRPVLTIANRAGHRVPGLTRRRITFVARVLDEAEDVVAEGERVLDHRTYLPVDEAVELELRRGGARLVVEGLHEAEGMREPVRFVKRTFDLQAPSPARPPSR